MATAFAVTILKHMDLGIMPLMHSPARAADAHLSPHVIGCKPAC